MASPATPLGARRQGSARSLIPTISLGGLRSLAARANFWRVQRSTSNTNAAAEEPSHSALSSKSFFSSFGGLEVASVEGLPGCRFCFEVKAGPSVSGYLVSCEQAQVTVDAYPLTAPRPPCDSAVTFKSEKVFRAVITKKLSDTAAVVTGRMKVTGSMAKLDILEPLLDKVSNAAAEEVNSSAGDGDEDTIEEEETEVWKTLKPSNEPTNVLSRQFWARHFSSDALVASWLWLLASFFYLGMIIIHLTQINSNTSTMALVNYNVQMVSGVARSIACTFLWTLCGL